MIDGEENIVKSAVEGDSSAFGVLYDHYLVNIYRFVRLKTGHREEAEDLTHQVFLHAWLHIKTYKHKGFPFSSWLYRIARNQVVDYYRAKKPVRPLEEVSEEELSDFSKDLHHETALKMEMDTVLKTIRTLRSEYQDVLIMRFVEELSIKETAHAIGKSEGAVKVIQHRATRELEQILLTSKQNFNGAK